MDKEVKKTLRKAEEEEQKHIPSLEELKKEDKDFKKCEKEAFRLLKKK